MEMLNYDQTLELVESFMEKSGIRDYCTNICKGNCCGSCYTKNPEACHRNEGRRLACSIYLCYTNTFPTNCFMEPFRKVHDEVIKAIRKVYREVARDYGNKYFKTPPKELFSNFEISKTIVIDNLTPEFTKKVKKYIDMIVKYTGKLKNEKGNYLRLSRFKLRCEQGQLYVHDYWQDRKMH